MAKKKAVGKKKKLTTKEDNKKFSNDQRADNKKLFDGIRKELGVPRKKKPVYTEDEKPAVATGKRMVTRLKKEGKKKGGQIADYEKDNMLKAIDKMDVSIENKERLRKLWKK